MSIIRFLSHPFWTGISALVAVIALFWSMGIGREFDRLSRYFGMERSAESTTSDGDGSVALSSSRRVALLIANSHYKPVALKNPENDIRKVSAALEARGFEIITKINLGYDELKKAIAEFEAVLKLGGIGVIYYAGHAIYRNGHDILLPIDIDRSLAGRLLPGARGLKPVQGRANKPVASTYQPPVIKEKMPGAVYLSELLAPIDVIVDKRRGDSGSVVIYSASRGQVALDAAASDKAHSPFAMAFSEAVSAGNLELFGAFRKISQLVPNYSNFTQTPTVEASVSKEFYFDRPWRDRDIGVLKIVVIDSCRTDIDLEALYGK